MRASHESARFVEDMIAHMTLEEKLGQLDLFHDADDPALEARIASGLVGGVSRTLQPRRLQALAVTRSRLGIPLLLIAPAQCEQMSPWALAASWDEGVAHAAGAAAAQSAARGGHNALVGPTVALCNAPTHLAADMATCDPYLASRLAEAFAEGTFEDAGAGNGIALSIATSLCSAGAEDRWSRSIAQAEHIAAIDSPVLDRLVAERAGFRGILIEECRRITNLAASHFSATSARSSLEATDRVIASGQLDEHEIDMAVRGVLSAKHALGLFRNPVGSQLSTQPSAPVSETERVRAAMVLLRNEAGLLPLSPVSDRVLVVGAPEGPASACVDALNRAGIGHAAVTGLALRRDGEAWAEISPGDHFAASLARDAAKRTDFVIVVLDDRHFAPVTSDANRSPTVWPRPTRAVMAMLHALASAGSRMAAIITTDQPVDLADADQYFAAVLQGWRPRAGFEEALADILSGRFSPQGRMPVSAGRFAFGQGLGFGETLLSGYALSKESDHVLASMRVRNAGSFFTRETIQVYIRDGHGEARLIAYRHLSLGPGDEVQVEFELSFDALGFPGATGHLELNPGQVEILVGKDASRVLSATVEISPALARAIVSRDRGYLRLAAS